MTGDWKDLFDRNLPLAFYRLHKWRNRLTLPFECSDDLQQEALTGLWKAAMSFDVERGISFATYACKCIDNQILMLLRKRKKQKSEISLDWILSENSDGNSLRLRDVLVSDISSHDKDVDGDTIKLLLRQVTKGQGVDVRAFRMYYFYGCSQGEIARLLGISQSYVSRIINRTKRKYAKLLIANDLLSKDFLEDYTSSRYRGRSESVI